MAELRVARSELILGGEKSGKTAHAESLAASWLARSPEHRAVYIATAQAWDGEMRERIGHYQRRSPGRMPRMTTAEEPLELAHAIGRHSRADTLIVVDCLTLWLTASLMAGLNTHLSQVQGGSSSSLFSSRRAGVRAPEAIIANALRACAGPIVLISNEAGLDGLPAGRNARAFVDALGGLSQEAAAACQRVTLMSKGLPLTLKDAS